MVAAGIEIVGMASIEKLKEENPGKYWFALNGIFCFRTRTRTSQYISSQSSKSKHCSVVVVQGTGSL